MCCYVYILICYLVSIILGHYLISGVIKHCWQLLEKDWEGLSDSDKKDKSFIKQTKYKADIKAILGVSEIILYITALAIFRRPEWIGGWLTLKLAVSWKSFDQNKICSSHNIFLLGNALTIIVSLIGSFFIMRCM